MRILVIGSGGREHALVWKIAQSPLVDKIYCAPGNAGTGSLAENVGLKADDLDALKAFAQKNKIDLTVVGPEVPLVAGIVDLFEKDGLRIFGPRQAAARIEGSKVFCKQIMAKYDIPTAQSGIFNQSAEAIAYINEMGAPIVVKADGLAAGKGVIVAQTKEEAINAVKLIMEQKEFGAAGSQVVIEECLVGEEASIIAFTDGTSIVPLASSQDHKRIFDNDEGPNTGGMGAYSPVPAVGDEILELVMERAVNPTLAALATRGIDYRGVLYAGLMLTPDGPKVIEFNVRFGDPETQVVLPRLSSDLAELLAEAAAGDLRSQPAFVDDAAVTVVVAAEGYPQSPRTGDRIEGLDAASRVEGVTVFCAGVGAGPDGALVTRGGRVLDVTALGPDLASARQRAYQAVACLSWPGLHVRTDIASNPTKEIS